MCYLVPRLWVDQAHHSSEAPRQCPRPRPPQALPISCSQSSCWPFPQHRGYDLVFLIFCVLMGANRITELSPLYGALLTQSSVLEHWLWSQTWFQILARYDLVSCDHQTPYP